MDQLNNFSDLPLANLPETGAPPVSRLNSVKTATEIYMALRKGDEPNSINRARVQAAIDGASPFDERQLRATGQAFRCNLNFGQGEAFLDSAMAAYIDLTASVEHLLRVETTVGELEQRNEWSGIISEEISRALRLWPDFNPRFLNLARNFVLHGVGISYFRDEWDWRFNSTGLDGIFVPRQTSTSEEELEVACAFKTLHVHELYDFIRDPQIAADLGWNYDQVRKAILKAQSYNPDNEMDWQRVQSELKNNDLYSVAKSATVQLIHLWVREFSGKVSHFISLEDGSNDDFLYKRIDRYDSMSQAFVFFPYGNGTNGTLHSIRGLGYKIYPHLQISNRLRSQMVDGAMLSSSMIIQPESEAALDSLAFNYMGHFAVMSPNVKFIDRPIPNMSTAAMPVLQDLTDTMNSRVGQYSAASVLGSNSEKTRFEVAARLDAASKLNVTSLTLFYAPWDRLLREVVRRIVRPGYTADMPGGAVITDIATRLQERGVPLDAFYAVDWCKTRAVRAVGAGSQAQRTVFLQQITELSSGFDPLGRRRLIRDQVAALVGYDQADRYIPADDTPRTPVDAKLAELENNQLVQGTEVSVQPNEMHLVHLDVHIPKMDEYVAAVEQGQMALEEATPMVLQIYTHATQHLEMVQADVVAEEIVAAYRNRLKGFNEILTNGTRRIEKLRREQEKAAAEAQQQEAEAPQQPGNSVQNPQLTPEMQEKLVEHRLKLQMMSEENELKLAQKQAEFAQKLRLRDAEKAVELRDYLK